LSLVEAQLKDPTKINDFIIDFAKFFNRNIFEKQGKSSMTTIIDGPSNSMKSTLIVLILQKIFSLQNIGIISTRSKEFGLEDILDKQLVMGNEYILDITQIPFLLELFSGENSRKIIQKYKKARVFEKSLPLIFITINFKQQMEYINKLDKSIYNIYKALLNRIKTFEFDKSVSLSVCEYNNIIKMLIKELPLIIIYCNKKAIAYYKNYNSITIDSKNKPEISE
jgi:hypothetical protein